MLLDLLLFFSFQNLGFAPEYQEETLILSVTGFSYEQHKGQPDWGYNGASPYIDTQNYPIAYTSTGSLGRSTGNYTFENLPSGSVNVTQVLFYAYARNEGSAGSTATLNAHPWNGSMWDDSYYDYKMEYRETTDWTLNFTDWAQFGSVDDVQSVNDAELYLESATIWQGAAPTLEVDYCYLNVTCSTLVPYERVYNIRYIFGLVGLLLMVAAPTYGVWEIKRNKNYYGVISAMIIFVIGWAFTLVWLTP